MSDCASLPIFRLRQLPLWLALAWAGVPSLQAQQLSGGLKEVVISGTRNERALEDVLSHAAAKAASKWTNVRGVAAGAPALDSYTAPGRSASIALVASF